jgi:hypothetical protein
MFPYKSEGKRFTIVHAGTSTGFLSGCDLLLSSEVEHTAYHKNINVNIFEKCSQPLNNVPFVCIYYDLLHLLHKLFLFVFDFVRFSFIVDTRV